MIIALAEQQAQSGSYLSTGLFLMGILALLFMLRRTLLARLRSKRKQREPRFGDGVERPVKERIREIDQAHWVARNKRAVRFYKHNPELTVEQAEHLNRIDKWQREHRGRGNNDERRG